MTGFSCPSLPAAASSPRHPAGRTAGSARTRSRDQSLENPFWGTPPAFPGLPAPKNAAGGRPLRVGLPPSTRTFASIKTKQSAQAPCSWGLGASTRRRRHWPAALPPRPQKRRRRQAPARGPAAVYSHLRLNRNETKRPSPLLVGLGCVYTAPKALAGGTAALPAKTPQSAGPCAWACRRLLASSPQSKRNKAPKPPTRGAWARVHGAEGTGRRPRRPAGPYLYLGLAV